jgi:hypothetical protein
MATPMIKRSAEVEVIEAELVPMNSLVASAIRVSPNDELWSTYRFAQETWQLELWRYYHCTPELHFIAEYIASAVSRVRLYIAEVDSNGRVGSEVETGEITAIADTLFGNPAAKAEALRAIAINLNISGECYIVGRGRRTEFDPEVEWFVASTTEFRRRQGQIAINLGNGFEKLIPRTDVVIRLWNPDPERRLFADSPARSCMEALSELEQLQMFERSQINSRLAGAGLLPIPAEMTNGPSDPSSESAADDVLVRLAEAGQAARSNQNSAGGVFPVLLEMPGELIQYMPERPIRFDSELSDKLLDYKAGAINRIARGMNIPPEVLTGMGETNHLSAWKIEEDFIKIHIEPLVSRICEGLNRAYVLPLLKAMGRDPKSYMLTFDTSPLTVRPNRLQDTLNLYERGIVSAEAVLVAGAYNPSTDAPSEEEEQKRFLKELLLRDPTLFQIPAIREELGFDIDTTLPMPEIAAGDVNAPGPAAPPRPERRVDAPTTPQQIPNQTTSTGGTPILASGALTRAPDAVLAASNVAVRRALELAGGRLLTRENRGRFPGVPKFEMHTKMRIGVDQAKECMAGAFDYLALDMAALDVNVGDMEKSLYDYCLTRIITSRPHDIDDLATFMAARKVSHV